MRTRRNESKCDWQATPSDYARIAQLQKKRRKRTSRKVRWVAQDWNDLICGSMIAGLILLAVVLMFWPT